MHTNTINVNKCENSFDSLDDISLRVLKTKKFSLTLSDIRSDIIIASRIKYGDSKAAFKGLLMEYSKSSTLHGIRYLFEPHRPFYERCFWLIILIISLYYAISLTCDTYFRWLKSPVILTFDENLVPIYNIPFPTVTVCPASKADIDVFNFKFVSQQIWDEIVKFRTFENRGNLTQVELEQFSALLHLCNRDVINKFVPYLPTNMKIDVAKELKNMLIADNNTVASTDDIGAFVLWNRRAYMEKIFTFVITDDGICYQFNGLHAKDIYRDTKYISYYDNDVLDFNNYWNDLPPFNNITGNWSLEGGYVDQGFNAYPQRSVYSNINNGLIVILLELEQNIDYTCRRSAQGYKVYLNSPESVPLTSGNHILIPHGHEVMVGILPQYIVAAKNLHKFPPEKRYCYFNDERYLRFFRYYSQSNCEIECFTNYTISRCGCAKFWMPKPQNVPVCGTISIDCYKSAEKEFQRIQQNRNVHSTTNKNIKLICDCIPACISLNYNVEISRGHFDIHRNLEALQVGEKYVNHTGARLKVYFKDDVFTAIKRTVLYGVPTLIANCGGIFALFMGMSGLSIIEIIYFFTLRLINTLRKRRNAQKAFLKQNIHIS